MSIYKICFGAEIRKKNIYMVTNLIWSYENIPRVKTDQNAHTTVGLAHVVFTSLCISRISEFFSHLLDCDVTILYNYFMHFWATFKNYLPQGAPD